MPTMMAASSLLALWTRTPVKVPKARMAEVSPMERTWKAAPNPVACVTRASTTRAADDTVR